jgi:hypothetical protein
MTRAAEQRQHPQFGMHDISLPGEDGIKYHLGHGDWIRLPRWHGLEIVGLVEVQAPAKALTQGYYDFVSAAWGRRWPAEVIRVARQRAAT